MKIKIIAMIMAVVLMFSGCMKLEQTVVINRDGSGIITQSVTYDKTMIIAEVEKSSGATMTAEDITAFDASMIESGYTLVTIDGKEYYQITDSQNASRDSLIAYYTGDESALGVGNAKFYMYYEYTPSELESTYASVSGQSWEKVQADIAAMGMTISKDSMEYIVTYQFPDPIVATNGTVDPTNPNRVSFNISLTRNTVVFASTDKSITQKYAKKQYEKAYKISAPKIKSLKANKIKKGAKKATATLKIKKVKDAKKYQIQYSTSKKFKKAKTVSTKKTTYKLKKLKKGKKYYVRVRAVKTSPRGEKVYSKWKKKSVRTKK